jgi:type I restriction enzyme S subunit
MSDEVMLSDVTLNITDGKHGDCVNEKGSGYYFLSVKDIKSYKIDFENARQITKADFIETHKRTKLEDGDILLANSGHTIGKMFYVNNLPQVKKATFQKSVAIIKPDKNKIHGNYLYYNLLANVEGLRKAAVGSAQPNLLLRDLRSFEITVHKGLSQQIAIANILSALDKKIELNNKINAELEAMAKLIYDYWFVQFDFPDANGKPYKSSGGKMVYNEELKREIPDGWTLETLDSIESDIVTGKTPSTKKTENFNGKIPFICIGDVRGNMHITKTEILLSDIGANSQANKYIPEGAICVTCIASPGLVGFASESSQTNQQLNTVVCKTFENRYYLYFYLTNYFRFAKAKSGNTFANMNKGDFSNIEVIKPSSDVLEMFSQKLKPLIEKVLVNSKENNKLIELRDWLLPMLMNGQVTVSSKQSMKHSKSMGSVTLIGKSL